MDTRGSSKVVYAMAFAWLFGTVACAGDGDAGDTDGKATESAADADGGDGDGDGDGDAGDGDGDGDGDGGDGDGGADPSAGCGEPHDDVEGEWTQHTVDVDGTERIYDVLLPQGYDDREGYAVVYEFHGCNSNEERENNNVPVEASADGGAIFVRGRAVDDCWDTDGAGGDVAFADALVELVESSYCADPDRRFATGYSSGSFMAHQLSCIRGDVYRGVASIAGGTAGTDCVGKTAALLIHDDTDEQVKIPASEGALARHLERNGCEPDASAPVDPDPCVAFEGCDAGYPVVWCVTTGQAHGRQDDLAGPAFWNFLSAL